jgi:hypothetical protein
MKPITILVLLGTLAVAGCVDRCTGKVSAQLKDPPEQVVHEKVKVKLQAAKDIASKACGVPADGLTEVTISPDQSAIKAAGAGSVRFEGKPIGAKDSKGDPVKALVCIGVVDYLLFAKTDEKGEVKDWELKTITLRSVQTKGVTWTPPSSKGDD